MDPGGQAKARLTPPGAYGERCARAARAWDRMSIVLTGASSFLSSFTTRILTSVVSSVITVPHTCGLSRGCDIFLPGTLRLEKSHTALFYRYMT